MDPVSVKQTPASTGFCSCCTCKSVAKFCLLYFTTLLVLTLIFTAISNEPLTAKQKTWWWAFLGSLLFTAAMSATALIIILYTDCYRIDQVQNTTDLEQSKGQARPMLADSQSASFKTVLTIDSRPPESNKTIKLLAENQLLPSMSKSPEFEQQPQLSSTKSPTGLNKWTGTRPITVLDMTAMRRGQKATNKLAESANLASISNKIFQDKGLKKKKKTKRKK